MTAMAGSTSPAATQAAAAPLPPPTGTSRASRTERASRASGVAGAAADLEGACGLKVLVLDPDLRPHQARQPGIVAQRRGVEVGADPVAGREDVPQAGLFHSTSASSARRSSGRVYIVILPLASRGH